MTLPQDRTVLPIVAVLPELERVLASTQRVVLEAPPGAGKSTYLPLWLLRNADTERRIVLIQPRRLAADNVARFLARQTGRPLGDVVGLRTRFDHKVSANTVIEVVTEGIFLRQIQRDPELRGIATVLFDEYHERSWQADVSLAFALEAQALWRAAEAPLTLLAMSATLPAAAVSAWLDAPVVRAEGRSFPVTLSYQPPGRQALPEHLVAQIEAALAAGARKILVFVAGWQTMQRVQRGLGQRDGREVYLLHSQVPPEQQRQAMLFQAGGPAAVVLATNIAETSLTIEGVDTVIDSGQVRRPSYDIRRGMDQLETGWISKASAEQRAGRAGRLGPGHCVRLWSQEQQGRLAPQDPAEIQQVDLAPLALELALWGSDELRLPDEPSPQRMNEARQLLQRLGALDAGGRITGTGRAMAELGLHPRLGRLVLSGRETGQLRAACQLAALLSEGDFLRFDADSASADLDLRLQVLQRRRNESAAAIAQGTLQRVRQLAEQLWLRSGGKAAEAGPDTASAALLAAAFPDRLARQREPGSNRYLSVDGFEVALDPGDALRGSRWLVVVEHDGGRQGARIRLAAALDEADIESPLATQAQTIEEVFWDEARAALSFRRLRRMGAIVLDERAGSMSDDQANAFWLAQLRERGLAWLNWPPAVSAWLGRVRWAATGAAADWPDYSEAALLADMEAWLLPYLLDIRRLEQLRALDFMAILQSRLNYAQQQELERRAPARFALPSGQSHDIDYSGDGAPRLAARVQEFYGLDRHPGIAGGAQPLLLELLSPARRPVQVTQDLPGFWRSSYPEVRKEMKGRYPKHFWPEEPWRAPATTTTKKRMKEIPE